MSLPEPIFEPDDPIAFKVSKDISAQILDGVLILDKGGVRLGLGLELVEMEIIRAYLEWAVTVGLKENEQLDVYDQVESIHTGLSE